MKNYAMKQENPVPQPTSAGYSIMEQVENDFAHSKLFAYALEHSNPLPPVSAETHAFAQQAMYSLDASLGPTDHVKETITGLLKEATGLYRMQQLEVV